MPESYDIVIRRARLRGRPGALFEVAVANGKVAAIEPRINGKGAVEVDAEGGLVTESFVNTHLHLCKVYTLQMMDEEALEAYHGGDMGKAMNAIELAARVKDNIRRIVDYRERSASCGIGGAVRQYAHPSLC